MRHALAEAGSLPAGPSQRACFPGWLAGLQLQLQSQPNPKPHVSGCKHGLLRLSQSPALCRHALPHPWYKAVHQGPTETFRLLSWLSVVGPELLWHPSGPLCLLPPAFSPILAPILASRARLFDRCCFAPRFCVLNSWVS